RLRYGDVAAHDAVGQRLARQVLHREVRLAVGGLAEVEDLDDVLVPDEVDGARLVEEAGHDVGVARERDVQQLDGDAAADDRVLGEVDDPHPPLADLLDNLVVAYRLADQAHVIPLVQHPLGLDLRTGLRTRTPPPRPRWTPPP